MTLEFNRFRKGCEFLIAADTNIIETWNILRNVIKHIFEIKLLISQSLYTS